MDRVLSTAAPATIVIRPLVGVVFLLKGIKKFLFAAQRGAGRFAKIGIPAPQVTAPFVAVAEIACGLLLIVGFLTRPAALVLIINISVAIASTKIPILIKSGFWPMKAEARTDYSMLLGLIFLLIVGAGSWLLDHRIETAVVKRIQS